MARDKHHGWVKKALIADGWTITLPLNMKNTTTIIISLLSAFAAFGQDYHQQFGDLLQAGDTIGQRTLLEKWQRAYPDDPELYTSYFNHYFQKSRRELLSLDTEPDGTEALELRDSTGQIAGFIQGRISYDEHCARLAFEYIDKGIEKFPKRLDMRFGKIYVLGEMERWTEFTEEIKLTLGHSTRINNQWTWTNNEPVENGKDFMLSSVQDYQVQLFQTGDDALLQNMRDIAEKILMHYPGHVESLSNIAVTYLVAGDYDKSLEYSMKAKLIDPEDPIVLGNIAYCYKLMGDKATAIRYYQEVMRYGDDEASEEARLQIEELKK